jgi:hypothetical protein
MKTKTTMKTMMAVAAFVLATGAQAANTNATTGKLVVYRAGGVGMAKEPFFFDGQPHNLGFNRYREFEVSAGQHTMARLGTWTPGMDIEAVNVPAGGTIYFQYITLPFNLIFEVADDQARAARSAGKCRLQTTE